MTATDAPAYRYADFRYRATIRNEQRYVAPNPYNWDYAEHKPLEIPAQYKWQTCFVEVVITAGNETEARTHAEETINDNIDHDKVSVERIELVWQSAFAEVK